MRKNAFYPKAVFIALCLISIPYLQVTASSNDCAPESAAVMKLIRLCDAPNVFSTNPPPTGCENSDIVISFEESCTKAVPVAVYLTNIASTLNNSGIYTLPAGTPPIHLRYEYSPGNWQVTGPLTQVVHKGTIVDDEGEDLYIFGVDAFLDTYITNQVGCQPNDYKVTIFQQAVEVVTPTQYGYAIYPVLLHADETTGIFSCKVFHETVCMCGSGDGLDCSESNPPSYNYEVCMECDCSREEETIDVNPIDITTKPNQVVNTVFEITPNPFNDFVEVELIQETPNNSATVKIFNALGELVYKNEKVLSLGTNRFTINTSNFSSGTYYFILNDGSTQQSKKMILMDN